MGSLRITTWSMGRVVRELDGRLVSPTIEVASPTGVSTDSRTIEAGELFFALRGERFDGHEFVEQAVDAGAGGVVVEDSTVLDSIAVPGIVVDDSVEALGRLGSSIFREARQEGVHSIAVTGSNGKTTTKELLAAIWGIDGTVWSTPGNFNNHIGLPLTLCAIPRDCDHLVVEIGANHRGEISELIELVPADARVVTSIGRAHLEGFGSMAGVRKAKAEIFEQSERATTAVVPGDEHDALIPRNYPGRVHKFGTTPDDDIRVESTAVVERDGRMEMDVTLKLWSRDATLSLPFVGRHNATNLAAALATTYGVRDRFDLDAIDRALDGVELPGGRLRVSTVGPLRILDDAYNANPSSMRASFRAFEQWCRGGDDEAAEIAVIGDMHELGDLAGPAHRRLAQWLADKRRLSALIFVGEFSDVMAGAADDGAVDQVYAFSDPEDAADWLADVGPARLFLKGSRGNRLEQIVQRLESEM